MKIVRVLLTATTLLAAAACDRGVPTGPAEMGSQGPRNNLGMFGSGTVSSDPPVPLDPSATKMMD